MIIVAGQIEIASGARDTFVAASRIAINAAREAVGCLDFAVTADSLAPNRVRVFERWVDEESLMAFRGSGPGEKLMELITGADVRTFSVVEHATASAVTPEQADF